MTAKKKVDRESTRTVEEWIGLRETLRATEKISLDRGEKIRELESEVEELKQANRAHEETNLDLENDNAVLEDRIERLKVAMNTLVDSF